MVQFISPESAWLGNHYSRVQTSIIVEDQPSAAKGIRVWSYWMALYKCLFVLCCSAVVDLVSTEVMFT